MNIKNCRSKITRHCSVCPHEIRLIFSLYINIYKYFSSLSLSLSLDSFHNFRSFQQLKTGYGFNLCWFLVELCYLTRFFIGSCICLSPHPHPHLHSMIVGLRLNLPVALLQLCFQTAATKTKAKKKQQFRFYIFD